MNNLTAYVIVGCDTMSLKNVAINKTRAISGAGFIVVRSNSKYPSLNVTEK